MLLVHSSKRLAIHNVSFSQYKKKKNENEKPKFNSKKQKQYKLRGKLKKMVIAPSGLHSSMVLSVRFKRERCATSRKKV